VRPLRDGRLGVHPARRAAARVGPGWRRDAVAPADGRRSPAREIVFLCDEVPAAQAEEWGLVNASSRSRARRAVDEWVEKLARGFRRRRATRSSS
jgi:enoyl-CoA hydratase/carnithine racemase